MGQTKSKTWRRLSESDCVHLLNDDELNNHNQNNLFPPASFQNQEFKYHTITNAKKWNNGNSSNDTASKCNIATDDIFGRNRSGSACLAPSTEATLLKFSKFDNGEFVQNVPSKSANYNKNLFEASKNGSFVRKTLPSCPASKIFTPVQVGSVGLRHPPPPSAGRFYPSMLEPELLLRPNKSTNIDSIEQENAAFRQSDLIESPPPLPDPSSPFKPSNTRPITMYQFEPFSGKPGSNFTQRSSIARGLSLSDILEQCNTFDDCTEEDEFSDSTLVDTTAGTLPPTDTGDHSEEEKDLSNNPHNNSNNCLLVDISTPEPPPGMLEQQQPGMQHVPRMAPAAANGIRCSGLDCICDRCIQHRFKLLNWLLPNCTRINAERLLHGRMEGTFLVRKSEKFPGQYTLSFVCRRTVRHCLIMRSVYGFGLRWPYSFETLQQVIIHYARTTLAEFNSKLDVRLRYPVFMT